MCRPHLHPERRLPHARRRLRPRMSRLTCLLGCHCPSLSLSPQRGAAFPPVCAAAGAAAAPSAMPATRHSASPLPGERTACRETRSTTTARRRRPSAGGGVSEDRPARAPPPDMEKPWLVASTGARAGGRPAAYPSPALVAVPGPAGPAAMPFGSDRPASRHVSNSDLTATPAGPEHIGHNIILLFCSNVIQRVSVPPRMRRHERGCPARAVAQAGPAVFLNRRAPAAPRSPRGRSSEPGRAPPRASARENRPG